MFTGVGSTAKVEMLVSSQVIDDQEAEREKYDCSGPEDPFVLLCSSFNHSYSIATDAKRVGYTVEFPLGAFENVTLLSQVTEYCSATLEKLIKL